MIRRSPLRRKYALYFVLLVTVALVASGGVSVYFTHQETTAALLELQREKAQAAAGRIEAYVQEIDHQLGWMRLPSVDKPTLEQRRIEYLKLLRQVPAITDVSYVDAGGRERLKVSRVGMDVSDAGTDFAADPRFTGASGGKSYFSPVYFRKDTEPYMTISTAMAGREAGVTVAEVNLKFIWDVISRIRVGERGLAYAVDARGQLIAHPDISLVLQKTDFSGLEQVKAAQKSGSHAGPGPQVSIAKGFREEEVLTAYAAIPDLGWSVFVEQPLQEAFAPLYASLRRTGYLLLLGLAFAIGVSLLLAQRMVTPIRALQEGAARIGAGNLDQRIEVKTRDELEALAEQFNNMAAQLKESYAGLERKVEERTHQLEVANQHKTEFLANMSHELRTPLNAIIGFSEVLQQKMFGEMNAKQAEYIDDIHTSGKHLLSLINDILDLSKVEAGRTELDLAEFDVVSAIDNARLLVRERAQRQGIELVDGVESNVGSIVADERKFKQILLNLLSNAVKFTPQGGRVTVAARRLADRIEVSVADTGVGIAAADQEKVFEAFKQVGTDVMRKAEGTGLGLTLTRKFVELHGGAIRVASEPGKGSVFTFTLPLVASATMRASGPAPTTAAAQPAAPA